MWSSGSKTGVKLLHYCLSFVLSQEEFRSCADLRISAPSGWYDSSPNTDVDKDGSVQDLVRAEAGAEVMRLSLCLLWTVILCSQGEV